MGDSFPAFALKCLAVLEVLPRCHHGATTSGEADETVTVRKATSQLLEANVVFRGAKVNATMASAVLTFRTSINSGSMRLFANLENQHGREVMGLHYNKIARLVQTCTEASKIVGSSASELVEASLGAIHFALRNDILKPADVTIPLLDGQDRNKKRISHGFTLKAVARHAFVQHLELERAELEERAGTQAKTIVNDLRTLLDAVKTYAKFEKAFNAPDGTTPQEHLEDYKEKTMSTKLGRDAVDLIYDVLGGEHDDALAEQLKPEGEWAKLVDWRFCDIAR